MSTAIGRNLVTGTRRRAETRVRCGVLQRRPFSRQFDAYLSWLQGVTTAEPTWHLATGNKVRLLVEFSNTTHTSGSGGRRYLRRLFFSRAGGQSRYRSARSLKLNPGFMRRKIPLPSKTFLRFKGLKNPFSANPSSYFTNKVDCLHVRDIC